MNLVKEVIRDLGEKVSGFKGSRPGEVKADLTGYVRSRAVPLAGLVAIDTSIIAGSESPGVLAAAIGTSLVTLVPPAYDFAGYHQTRKHTRAFWEEVAQGDSDAGVTRKPQKEYAVWADANGFVRYKKRRDKQKIRELLDEAHLTVIRDPSVQSTAHLKEDHSYADHSLPHISDLFRGQTTLYDSTSHRGNDRLADLEINGTELTGKGDENGREVGVRITYHIVPRRLFPDRVYVHAEETRIDEANRRLVTTRAISPDEVSTMQGQALARATARYV